MAAIGSGGFGIVVGLEVQPSRRPVAAAFLRLAGLAAASTLAPMRREIILAAALVLAQAMSGVATESAQVNRERVNSHF